MDIVNKFNKGIRETRYTRNRKTNEEFYCIICQTGSKENDPLFTYCACEYGYHKSCFVDLLKSRRDLRCTVCKGDFSVTFKVLSKKEYFNRNSHLIISDFLGLFSIQLFVFMLGCYLESLDINTCTAKRFARTRNIEPLTNVLLSTAIVTMAIFISKISKKTVSFLLLLDLVLLTFVYLQVTFGENWSQRFDQWSNEELENIIFDGFWFFVFLIFLIFSSKFKLKFIQIISPLIFGTKSRIPVPYHRE